MELLWEPSRLHACEPTSGTGRGSLELHGLGGSPVRGRTRAPQELSSIVQSPRDVCIEASSHTAPKGVDREGPRKEDARKEDPEPLEHDLIASFNFLKPH